MTETSKNSQPIGQGNRKSIIVKTPQSMTMFSATAKCILDELRERHKSVEKNRKLHPTELLTLDKLNEALFKYSNLSEQGKSPSSVDQALKQLTDYANNGKERYLYLYPFLIKSGNKVIAKIGMIAPQISHEYDAAEIREACFNYSKGMVDLILTNRAKKVKEVDESNPGLGLFQKLKSGQDWLSPNRFSLESEISQLIKGGFKPYSYFPLKDFIHDFIDYGESKNSLETLGKDYHIIIDEIQIKEDGSYIRQPEMVIHYRAQADALEKFVLKYLPKFCDEVAPDFKSKLNQFKAQNIDNAPEGRRQSREKMKALIDLVNEFPLSSLTSEAGKRFRETVTDSIGILNKLISNMDKLIGRKYDSISKTLTNSIVQMIAEHTKTELSLYVLDIKSEIERAGIKEKEKIDEISSELIKAVSNSYPIKESRDIDGNKIYYTVDQSYMAGVLHKYATTPSPDSQSKREHDIAKEMNEEMVRTKNPRLNVNIRQDLIDQLAMDISRHQQDETAKMRSDFYSNKFNFLAGFLTLAIGIFISVMMFSVENDFIFLIFGIPISLFLGYFAAILIKKRVGGKKAKTPGQLKQAEYAEESKDEKLNQIARAANKFVFPTNYNKAIDKVYDNQSLKSKINEKIGDIQSSSSLLMKEKDQGKVASAIEHAIYNTAVIISIPPEVVAPTMPSTIIINKNDFKTPLYRSQLSEHYRELAEKKKGNKALIKYYTFLINTLEVDYPKYLNKKIR